MQIKKIKINKILDSREEETIEVVLVDKDGIKAKSQIPKGKSTGSKEAVCVGYEKAKENSEKILKKISEREFSSISEIDNFLIKLDGTENKSNLGGDLMLGISISFARLLAQKQKKELWEVLKEEFFKNEPNSPPPHIFANMINGGEHAKNNLTFQEYIVVAKTKNDIKNTKKELINFYQKLKETLKEKTGLPEIPLGDEAGFCLNFKNSQEPFFILQKLIKENFSKNSFLLATDAAANSFYKNGKYTIDKKEYDSPSLAKYYQELFLRFDLLFSIEDPFYENDLDGFLNLKNMLPNNKIIVGDDLTTTNQKEIEKNKEKINGVIIKANQIGTLTETMEAIKTAHKNNIKTIISHRSGETNDCFLIHIAKASNAFGVKIGPPARERLLKYEELERIYL